MKKVFKTIALIFVIAFLLTIPSRHVNAKKETNKQNIFIFYSETCPHCKAEIKYLNKLLGKKEYNNISLNKLEVSRNKDNLEKFEKAADLLDTTSSSVPFLVIGTDYIIGYDPSYNERIEQIISYYNGKDYQDPVNDLIFKTDTSKLEYLHYGNKNNEYKVPVLGKINAKSVSLLTLSVVLGAIDGFNPCAMWILLFLLSLLISTKDRKKMWILGLTFILTSGFVYLCFMLSWLSVAKYTAGIIFVRYLIGVFACVFGSINVYRYIKSVKNKNIGCDVTDANKKRKIMERIRNILLKNKLIFAVLGIMLLAISVNLIELLCSLGLPVMFTEILGLNNLNAFEYGLYLFIYLLFFLIDDLIIFFIAMKTLKIKGISNKYTKYSHLIGGSIMLIVGLLMIIKPEWIMLNF